MEENSVNDISQVVLLVDAEGLEDREKFEKHLKREGLESIEDEEFAYGGESHTHLLGTRAYLLDVVKKALKKSGFKSCRIMFQIGENPPEAYRFDLDADEFVEVIIKEE